MKGSALAGTRPCYRGTGHSPRVWMEPLQRPPKSPRLSTKRSDRWRPEPGAGMHRPTRGRYSSSPMRCAAACSAAPIARSTTSPLPARSIRPCPAAARSAVRSAAPAWARLSERAVAWPAVLPAGLAAAATDAVLVAGQERAGRAARPFSCRFRRKPAAPCWYCRRRLLA